MSRTEDEDFGDTIKWWLKDNILIVEQLHCPLGGVCALCYYCCIGRCCSYGSILLIFVCMWLSSSLVQDSEVEHGRSWCYMLFECWKFISVLHYHVITAVRLWELNNSCLHKESNWEQFQPFVLYAYWTRVRTTTVSHVELLYGRKPTLNLVELTQPSVFDLLWSCQTRLQAKMHKLHDQVELNRTHAALEQKRSYNSPSWVR